MSVLKKNWKKGEKGGVFFVSFFSWIPLLHSYSFQYTIIHIAYGSIKCVKEFLNVVILEQESHKTNFWKHGIRQMRVSLRPETILCQEECKGKKRASKSSGFEGFGFGNLSEW